MKKIRPLESRVEDASLPYSSRFFLLSRRWLFASFLLVVGLLITISWPALVRTYAASQGSASAHVAANVGAQVIQGPGFDTCDTPSSSELGAWWGASPYRWLGTYLGGEAIGSCSLTNLT